MLITKDFTFAAAHFLTNYNGKCENLHGHTYKLEVTVEAEPNESGIAFDFTEIKAVVNELIIDVVDHADLNAILGPHPSAENLSLWVWKRLEDPLPLYEIVVWEYPTSRVTLRK